MAGPFRLDRSETLQYSEGAGIVDEGGSFSSVVPDALAPGAGRARLAPSGGANSGHPSRPRIFSPACERTRHDQVNSRWTTRSAGPVPDPVVLRAKRGTIP